ncbi:hypothetical protein MHYP_G00252050 [Metynnis hypsauchen]
MLGSGGLNGCFFSRVSVSALQPRFCFVCLRFLLDFPLGNTVHGDSGVPAMSSAMEASSRKVAGKQRTTTCSADNEELIELLKLAVAKAFKVAIPTPVEEVVAQLTNKRQAPVDAEVFRGEMVAMQANISKVYGLHEEE